MPQKSFGETDAVPSIKIGVALGDGRAEGAREKEKESEIKDATRIYMGDGKAASVRDEKQGIEGHDKESEESTA